MKIGITGHQRLESAECWEWVRRELAALLQAAQLPAELQRHAGEALSAYSSLAAGADQEFAEAAVRANIPLVVIVPSRGYERAFSDPAALTRYRALLEHAADVRIELFDKPSEEAFLAAGKSLVDAVDLLIAVWDGRPAKGKGGTAEVVAYARQQGRALVLLDPALRTITRSEDAP